MKVSLVFSDARQGTASKKSPAPIGANRFACQRLQALENGIPDNCKTCRAALVRGVGPPVPVKIEGSIVQIDEIHRGNARLKKRKVIVINSPPNFEKEAPVAEPFGLGDDEISQPGSGESLALNIEMRVSNHVDYNHGLDSIFAASRTELSHKIAASVQAVGRRPVRRGLLTIEESNPVSQVVLSARQLACEFDQEDGA